MMFLLAIPFHLNDWIISSGYVCLYGWIMHWSISLALMIWHAIFIYVCWIHRERERENIREFGTKYVLLFFLFLDWCTERVRKEQLNQPNIDRSNPHMHESGLLCENAFIWCTQYRIQLHNDHRHTHTQWHFEHIYFNNGFGLLSA